MQVCAATPEREAYLLLHPEDTVTLTAELPRFAFAISVQQGTRAGTLTATGPDGQSVSVALCYAEPALDPSVKATPFAAGSGACGPARRRYFPLTILNFEVMTMQQRLQKCISEAGVASAARRRQ